ncbi:MAG: hypothetical protein BWK77_01425 [Verrucomicrobia bacterium A1]|nr:MAG: hypothetical protein BWK77_01425 [Verrucomicrobia bacterium A1]
MNLRIGSPALACVIPMLVAASVATRAGDWPQWRGPFHNGVSDDTGLPVGWSATNGIAWTAPLPGSSASTPVIAGGRVFASTAETNGNLALYCLDARDGTRRWVRQLGSGDFTIGRNNLASPSPVTDGQRVFALYGSGDLAALDATGRVLWARNLAKESGKFAHMWNYGSSPLLLDGKLYVQVLQRHPPTYKHAVDDHPERSSYLLCVDPDTGRDLWKHVRATPAVEESMESYATPVPHTGPGGPEILIVGGDCVTAHRPDSGEEIWRCFGLNPKGQRFNRIVPSPAALDGMVFACCPKRGPVLGIRDGGRGDVTASHAAWAVETITADVCTPLPYKGRLYIVDGDKKEIACLDPATGTEKWHDKLPVTAILRASPTGADGRVYCLSKNGEVVVLAAGDEFKVLSTVALGDGPCRASMAVADGRLFIRTASKLTCVGRK